MEYMITWGTGHDMRTAFDNLQGIVNENIQNGWEPQGGICTAGIGQRDGQEVASIVFAQAMIKRP
ncbi:hypothetical protein [Cupriavidus numazuensis]|uniref:DUF1737 domain-containing protein n=1 Tax=Cupriavidus numazuensis TaxID=221992 RepID=A0ABN7PPR2_9BURK|nr:hypothetical protein [Cupriavidus numazuensis]CAG2129040.1 hypothetical protein LMG26411_00107 [Cupriavidus numazuensis]